MDNLRLVAVGLAVVAVDLRFNGADIVTDGIGWVLAFVGLLALARLHGGFQVAAVAAAVGGISWAGDPWLGIDRDLASWGEVAAQTVVVFAMCTALMTLVPEKRESANRIRWADLGLGLVAVLVGAMFEGTYDAGPALLILLLVIPALVVFVCFLVLLLRCAPLAPQPVAASE